ncbi:alpha/beta hydrolase [Leifsonia sp. C5G2]|uniref:alpha/beta hydrolase n=1 Tax=Leifsonia sp. C5G2 TaxID=2735269 RepID=UPI00201C01FE|nr:alpha/beta hydrolase [Leifsonia sp. C5G2]
MASRWADWSPAGFETDPTPGDPALVDGLSSHLTKWAGKLEGQAKAADDLVNTGLEAAAWSGLAADVFRDRLRTLADAARVASSQHTAGSAAATTWRASMKTSQDAADTALQDAEDAQADVEEAQDKLATLSAEHAALLLVAEALQKAYASGAESSRSKMLDARRKEQDSEDKLIKVRSTIEDAQERLDDARKRATLAKYEYDAAEKTFATALDDALHGAMPAIPAQQLASFGMAVSKLSAIPGSASVNASLMDTLTTLTPDELRALIAQDPEIVQRFWEHPPSPDKAAAWWKRLLPEQQAAFQAAAPEILGNLAGLPYGVRNTCNLAAYESATKRDDLTPEQRKVLTALAKVLRDKAASLVCFNLDASVPMVAVGYGDLDTADTVTWAAPGMQSDATDGTTGWSRAAWNLYDQQRLLDGGRSHGVVGWLGYDTPDLVSVNNPALAQDGAWRFANELDGTHAARAGKLPYVGVVAHSYGTTMAANALTHTKYPVDSFTMLGSAGIDADTVHSLADLHVKKTGGVQAIYTTSAQLDFLAPFGSAMGGRAQPNPEAAQSPGAWAAPTVGWLNPPKTMTGAQSFSSEGATLPSGQVLKPTQGHSPIGENVGPNLLNGIAPEGHGYLDRDTESLYNAALTTIGLPGDVVGGLRSTK